MEEVVFSLSIDHVKGVIDGKRKALAGHVVLVKANRSGFHKVLDTYITYPMDIIVDYQTTYSLIDQSSMAEGVNRSSVINFLLQAIKGRTLVTFAGDADFASLGIHRDIVRRYAANHIELQDYFKRPNGQAYGLGPIMYHFRLLEVRHLLQRNLFTDAAMQIKLYQYEYRTDESFNPSVEILSRKQYVRMLESF